MELSAVQKIDRHSPVPLYLQIAADIITRITQGEWSVGDKLPSEAEFVLEYSASRVTLRQALRKLEDEGLIERQRGRGAFIRANPSVATLDLFLPQVGVKHTSDILSSDIRLSVVCGANAPVLSGLDVSPETPLVYLERNFTRNGCVLGINRAWFPEKLVPKMAELGLIEDSITTTLQTRYRLQFHSVENYIESVALDASTAHQLQAASASPALKISSVYTIAGGTPIEYAITVWNGSGTQFHVMIAPGGK